MIWVTAEDVVAIHSRIIQVSGGIDGLRDRAGLEAAIAAPLQSFGGEDLFPTDIEKIARIGFGLASNHAFIDGNKRIGAMVTQLLLKWNGYQFQLEQNELADMFIGIADGTKDETELRYWLHGRVVLSFYRLFDVASHISSFHRLTKEEKPLSQLIVSISPSKSFFPELLILSAKLTYL